ncbi:hypothetical protein B0H13DRAFT_1850218 [Mycena leptocephala]|nr:hypothetical protein B0H13DRAFT_1850218 [Mycena leptocephala]
MSVQSSQMFILARFGVEGPFEMESRRLIALVRRHRHKLWVSMQAVDIEHRYILCKLKSTGIPRPHPNKIQKLRQPRRTFGTALIRVAPSAAARSNTTEPAAFFRPYNTNRAVPLGNSATIPGETQTTSRAYQAQAPTSTSVFYARSDAQASADPPGTGMSLNNWTQLNSEFKFIDENDEHADIASGERLIDESLVDEVSESSTGMPEAETQAEEAIDESELQKQLAWIQQNCIGEEFLCGCRTCCLAAQPDSIVLAGKFYLETDSMTIQLRAAFATSRMIIFCSHFDSALLLSTFWLYASNLHPMDDTTMETHVLTAIHGSNGRPNSLRRKLNILRVDHDCEDSIGQLRRRLKSHIATLRRGKKAEKSEELERAARAKDREKYREELDRIRRMWQQLILQSLKNKRIRMFREQTSSEALSTFTCAAGRVSFEIITFNNHQVFGYGVAHGLVVHEPMGRISAGEEIPGAGEH